MSLGIASVLDNLHHDTAKDGSMVPRMKHNTYMRVPRKGKYSCRCTYWSVGVIFPLHILECLLGISGAVN